MALVVMLMFFQIWRSGWCNDEAAHIPAGLYHLETGKMDAYRVNPPFPRMLAALPLLIDQPKMKWFSLPNLRERSEYVFAHSWISENFSSIPRQLRITRLSTLIFFLLGVWTIWKWSDELYGRSAAYLALSLWCLSPDVITYSAIVAPDLPAAATGLFACYLYWSWLRRSTNNIPWKVCVGVALACLSKFSWLFLFIFLPCLTLVHDVMVTRRRHLRDVEGNFLAFISQRMFRLTIALICAIVLINFAYGFEGTGRTIGSFQFISAALGGNYHGGTGNRFDVDYWRAIPVPVPSEMLQGIDFLKWEFEVGHTSYLRGHWKDTGWWYFYIYAMAVKFPIGYILLTAIGTVSLVTDCVRGRAKSREWVPLLCAGTFVGLISVQAGFTHHLRYVLPAFGFLYIVAARSILALPKWLSRMLILASFAEILSFHLTHLGQSHCFFNALAGGPENGWRHLGYSNVDWGQSTFRMANWAHENPDKRPLTLLFVSSLGNPERMVEGLSVATNVRWKFSDPLQMLVPTEGWYLLSSLQLTYRENEFFRLATPVNWPYADMALFYVAPDN